MTEILHYFTGYELLDICIAGLTAFCGRKYPEEVTRNDLTEAAGRLHDLYLSDILLKSLFPLFQNSGYVNHPTPESVRAYADCLLLAHEAGELDEPCHFLPHLPVVDRVLSVGVQASEGVPGKVARQHIPLLAPMKSINFGGPDIKISWPALLAFQMAPLCLAHCAGGVLGLHSADPETIRIYAGFFLEKNLQQLVRPVNGQTKLLPTMGEQVKVSEVVVRVLHLSPPNNYMPVRVIHFSNRGQAPFLNSWDVPPATIGFLRDGSQMPGWDKVIRSESDGRRASIYFNLAKVHEPKQRGYISYLLTENVFEATGKRDSINFANLHTLLLERTFHMADEELKQIHKLAENILAYMEESEDAAIIQALRRRDNTGRILRLIYDANEAWMVRGSTEKRLRKSLADNEVLDSLFQGHGARLRLRQLSNQILSLIQADQARYTTLVEKITKKKG